MTRRRDLFPFALAVIGLGTLISFYRATQPFFDAGHVLRGDLLVVGLLPYIVYGIGASLRRDWLVAVLGVFLLAGNLWFGVTDPGGDLPGSERLLSYPWPWAAAAGLVLLFSLLPAAPPLDEADEFMPAAAGSENR